MDDTMDRSGLREGGLWTHLGDKLTIGTVDGDHLEIVAQYNPKELAFSTSASWNPQANPFTTEGGRGCRAFYQYGSTDSRTLTAELVFDGFEQEEPIATLVEALESLTVPIDPTSRIPAQRRPPLCVAIWGEARPFRCFVQSVATRITMFSRTGQPLRAVCTVTLKEADIVAMLKADQEDGDLVRQSDERIAARSRRWRERLELE